ncbi:MAG: DUF4173 domain-containing protein [Actinomycetia bacterium]|nr:DUF4173 domain-containing protein [Actinomycetes bacterium]
MNADRPLDQVSSIKTKLGVLVGASVVVGALFALIGDRAGVPVWMTLPVSLGLSLVLTYWLARGMTAPLREMTAAATAMAAGDYSRTVTATSTDEVGSLARAFTTMATDLAATDQQRRELISTVSHELRTPLAAQRAVLENLVDGVTRPSEETLSVALAQTERLSDLVEDLLDLSRLESGSTGLDLSDVDVTELLEGAAREAGLGGRDVRIDVTAPAGMRVRADRGRLGQVLANLLDNALRHSPSGGLVQVSASAARGPGEVGRWILEVRDQGPGIDPAVAERIFERFSTGGEHAGSTGLGLAIARWICSLHGGVIEVVPAPSGAHMRVTLPIDPTPPTPALAQPVATRRGTMPSPTAQPAPTPPATAPPATVSSAASVPPARPGAPFASLWPERDSRPQPAVLLGSLGVGALAAILAFDHRLGLIAFVVLLLAGVLMWVSSAYRGSRLTQVSAGLAVLLGVALIWRAAEWVGVVSVLIAAALAAMALTRATKVSGILAALASWPLSGLRGLPLLGRTISATSRHATLWPLLRTVAFSVVALVLFGGLFASADAVFGQWANAVIPDLQWDSIIARAFVMFMVSGVTLAGCYLAINPPAVDDVVGPASTRVRLWEWAVPVGLVCALFAGFLLAQASATLRGHDYVLQTTGMSYADYVHQGFGQLIVATVLMLAVVALTLRKAPQRTDRERLWIRILLGLLSVLTLAVLASALWRMHLYQQAYGFTSLRLFVDAFIIWLAVIVVGVLVSLLWLSTRWLGRTAVLAAGALMVALSAINPDAWVAQHNIDRFAASGRLDAAYLATLSDDAAPTIAASSLPVDIKSCILHVDAYRGAPREVGTSSWLELNLGRERAREARASVPAPDAIDDCLEIFSSDLRENRSR